MQELAVLHDQRRIEGHPRVLIGVSSEHLDVGRPAIRGIRGAMNSQKSLAILLDEYQQISFWGIAHKREVEGKVILRLKDGSRRQ
jgi:hypothetical protein